MRSISLLLLLLGTLSTASGQITDLSPYSRFGIGEPDHGSFVSQSGMAGAGVAVVDGLHIHSFNPAGQVFLSSPVFEVGAVTERLTVNSSDASSVNSNTRLNHFAIGFPMWNGNWGAAFGLRPYSTVGYTNTVEQYSSSVDTTYTAEYIGSGGVNRIFLDIARRFTVMRDTSKYHQDNVISIGLGGSYLFGSVNSERNAVFPLNSGFISTRIEDATTLTDLAANAGLMGRFYVNRRTNDKDRNSAIINLGATYSQEGDINSRRSRNAYTYFENVSGVEFPRDSIAEFKDRKGTITLPGKLSVGVSYEYYQLNKERNRQRKLMLAVDYTMSDWAVLKEDFGNEVSYSGMGEFQRISAGAAYSPQIGIQKGSRGNLFRLSTYRLGLYQGNSHLSIEGQQISESGMSFGMSIPLLVKGRKETDTQFDFSVTYEQRGTTADQLLEEQGLRFMFGFSFHPDYRFDRWFNKRKYD